jgi:hypothetical protein
VAPPREAERLRATFPQGSVPGPTSVKRRMISRTSGRKSITAKKSVASQMSKRSKRM